MQEPETSSLITQAAQSRRLEKTIHSWPSLRGVTFSVGPIKKDKLKIFVSTPAALTRLRQSLPSLIQHLQGSGLNINEIQLQIQTNPLMSKQLERRPKKAVFSEAAKKAWLDLESRLADSPLKEATQALNKHHKFK
ncbi:MAG: flagellar hook-length control protein FliK [Burkholderiales bacterium]|jgi:hypothetical protein|uniref:hypothetical protein n=1 Tax=Limnobacter sp. TaxID=2003368 RepID=UPI0039BD8128|nr:flagellar hook-length control protein FliK [Burkholderiales bacterium]